MEDTTHLSYALAHAVGQPDVVRPSDESRHHQSSKLSDAKSIVKAARVEKERVEKEQDAARKAVREGFSRMKEDVAEQKLERLKNELEDLHDRARTAAAAKDADEARALAQKVAATLGAVRTAAGALKDALNTVDLPELDPDAPPPSLSESIRMQSLTTENPNRDVAEARVMARRIFGILNAIKAEEEENNRRKDFSISRAEMRATMRAFIIHEFGVGQPVLEA